MFKKKKFLLGLVTILALMTICVQNARSDDANNQNKSGWDYIQANDPASLLSPPSVPVSTNNAVPKYQEGDIEKGVLRLKAAFNAFPPEKTISINLRDADVKEVIKEIVREGGKNLILDETVTGTVNCDLENVTLNQALELILEAKDLDMKQEGNNIYVASKPVMAMKGLNRKVIKSFKLNYANALDVASIIEASIFNKGIEITSKLAAKEEKAKGKSTSQGQAASKANIDTTKQTTGPGNYQMMYIPPESSIDIGGARMYTDQIPEGNQNIGIGVDRAEAAAAAAESSTFGALSTGSVALSKAYPLRAVESRIDTSTGYNSGSSQAANIKIQGENLTSTTVTVSNNNGGPIVIPDTRTNSLLVAGVEEDIYTAEKTIQYLDKPLKQVSIDVSLIEMSRSDSENLGLTIASGAKAFTGGFNNIIDSTSRLFSDAPILSPNAYTTTAGGTIQPNNLNAANWAKTIGIATAAGETALQVSTIKNITSNIAFKINALITKQKAKIIANPNVIALDNSETLIKLTEQVINRVTTTTSSTGVTQTSIDLFDAGIVLNVKPHVSNDGYVTLRIRPSLTSPSQTKIFAGNELTLIATREVLVENVRVKSGETLALAGLIRERSAITENKLPILADLPFVGKLFRQVNGTKDKTELIILLTPKLVDDIATQVSPIGPTGNAPID